MELNWIGKNKKKLQITFKSEKKLSLLLLFCSISDLKIKAKHSRIHSFCLAIIFCFVQNSLWISCLQVFRLSDSVMYEKLFVHSILSLFLLLLSGSRIIILVFVTNFFRICIHNYVMFCISSVLVYQIFFLWPTCCVCVCSTDRIWKWQIVIGIIHNNPKDPKWMLLLFEPDFFLYLNQASVCVCLCVIMSHTFFWCRLYMNPCWILYYYMGPMLC